MVEEVEYGRIYRINTHHPYSASLTVGDLVEIDWIEPHTRAGYDLSVRKVGEVRTWAITNMEIDLHCLNKGKEVDNYGC